MNEPMPTLTELKQRKAEFMADWARELQLVFDAWWQPYIDVVEKIQKEHE